MASDLLQVEKMEELCEIIEASRKGDLLMVMDLHQKWTGSCTVLL
jgi:hypothetical protein